MQEIKSTTFSATRGNLESEDLKGRAGSFINLKKQEVQALKNLVNQKAIATIRLKPKLAIKYLTL